MRTNLRSWQQRDSGENQRVEPARITVSRQAPADVRKKTGDSCRWEGNGGTSCSTAASTELGSESSTGANGTLGVGGTTPPMVTPDSGTCVEGPDGFIECATPLEKGETRPAPVPVGAAPTTIP